MSAEVAAAPTAARLPGDRWTLPAQKAVALAFWVVLPLLCLVVLALGTDHLTRHLNNTPAGIPGTYTVTSHSCSRELCTTGGTFTSSDGRVNEDDLIGVFSWQDGETHRALYDSESVDVIPLPAHWDPTATIIGMFGALVFVVLWSWLLFGSIRRRLAARGAGTEPHPLLTR